MSAAYPDSSNLSEQELPVESEETAVVVLAADIVEATGTAGTVEAVEGTAGTEGCSGVVVVGSAEVVGTGVAGTVVV